MSLRGKRSVPSPGCHYRVVTGIALNVMNVPRFLPQVPSPGSFPMCPFNADKEIVGDHVTMQVRDVRDHYGEIIVNRLYDGDYDKTNLPKELS
jgi:hypothetical protein